MTRFQRSRSTDGGFRTIAGRHRRATAVTPTSPTCSNEWREFAGCTPGQWITAEALPCPHSTTTDPPPDRADHLHRATEIVHSCPDSHIWRNFSRAGAGFCAGPISSRRTAHPPTELPMTTSRSSNPAADRPRRLADLLLPRRRGGVAVPGRRGRLHRVGRAPRRADPADLARRTAVARRRRHHVRIRAAGPPWSGAAGGAGNVDRLPVHR